MESRHLTTSSLSLWTFSTSAYVRKLLRHIRYGRFMKKNTYIFRIFNKEHGIWSSAPKMNSSCSSRAQKIWFQFGGPFETKSLLLVVFSRSLVWARINAEFSVNQQYPWLCFGTILTRSWLLDSRCFLYVLLIRLRWIFAWLSKPHREINSWILDVIFNEDIKKYILKLQGSHG